MSAGLLRIELRRSVALLLFPLLLAAAWWTSWLNMSSEVPGPRMGVYVWQYTGEALQMAVLFVGPLVAGLSAWVAGRDRRRGTDELLVTTARPSAFRGLATWAGTAIWGVSVYVLVAVALSLLTWWNATWGAPLYGYLLVGLLALMADSAIGFAAGYWFPGRFVAPLAAVGLWLGHIMPLGGTSFGARFELLSPAAYGYVGGHDVFYEVAPGAARQSLLFAGLCGVALATVALKDRDARRASRVALLASAVVTAIGLTATLTLKDEHIMPTADDGHVVTPEAARFTPSCEKGKITVCLHPAYEKVLPETVATITEVAEPLAGLPGAPTHALQDNYPETMPDIIDVEEAVYFYMPGRWARHDIAYGLVANEEAMTDLSPTAEDREVSQADLDRCGGTPNEKHFHPAYEAQAIVGDWLLLRAGGRLRTDSTGECPNADEIGERFAALSPTERNAWLEENLAGLRAGGVTLKDLP